MKKRKSKKALTTFYQEELYLLKQLGRKFPYASRNELIRKAVRFWAEQVL